MSFTKYPKNYHSNGYGWHNMAAMGYSKPPPPPITDDTHSINSQASSGVSSLYPSASGYNSGGYGGGGFGGGGMSMPPLPYGNVTSGGGYMPMPYQPAPPPPPPASSGAMPPPLPTSANIGMQLSYGFSPDCSPGKVPNPNVKSPSSSTGSLYPSLGWAMTGDSNTRSIDSIDEADVLKQTETPIQAILVPIEDQPIYNWSGFLRGAGEKLLNQAVGAASEYIGNAIQEMMVVKKEAEVPRTLPSLKNMKVLGEKSSGLHAYGTDIQDFNTLRSQCLQSGHLFEDPDFPAVDSSLQFSRRPDRHVEWLRPMEIADDPQFFVEGYSRFDVQQGELGDCWLLAAAATLTQDPKLFFRVVPDDQSFAEDYAGIFHFRFWQYGRWIDVVVDDRLPTYRGELLYMHSTEKNEFWSALLEKAYAKLHGSYEALKGGTTCEAMEDFTGGVTEMYDLKEAPPNLFSILMKGYERNSMMGCSIEPDPAVLEAETPQGLIKGHAYSITKVQLMDIVTPNTSGKIPMIRMRNPWGNEAEWNGPWSDQSSEWRFIPEHVKIDIGLTFDTDGEFWMSFQDWMNYFDRVEMCNLSPDSLSEEQVSGGKKKWEMSVYEGEWTEGVTAGGCRNYIDTFWHNPQYVMELVDPDEDDDDGMCTAIVALMQKNRRSRRNMGMDCLTIGFAVYRVTDRDLAQKPLKMNFFKYNASVARSPAFINLREVSCRFKLPPGNYLIVPSTFEPNEEGEFLIRVFSENQNHMEENDEEVGTCRLDDRIVDPDGIESNAAGDDGQARKRALEKIFREIAGDDMEIDWMELKRILDHSMKDDFGPAGIVKASYTNQQHQQQQQHGGNQYDDGGGGGGGLLALICGAFCKDNPLAETLGLNPQQQQPPAQPQPNGNQFQQRQAAMAPQTITSQIHVDSNTGFSKDVCRSMVAMLDFDASGKLGFEEFHRLLNDIANWKAVFKLYDADGSGKLSAFELRDALNSAGYTLNNKILNALTHRYSDRDGQIAFDDFIMCSVKIKTMIDIFKERDIDGTNSATFNMEDWLQKTVYS